MNRINKYSKKLSLYQLFGKGIVLAGFFIFGLGSAAKADNFNAQIYQAYVSGNMQSWKIAMEEMESLLLKTGNYQHLYDLTIAQYGYIAFSMNENENRRAREYIKKAEGNLELLLDQYRPIARVHALRGAIYGYKVGLDPYKAVFFGRKAFTENSLAMTLSPDDPQVWMEKGNIELYKPEIFNPDSREAARIYYRAVELFEKDPVNLKYNWLYLNTLSNLAEAYITSGMYNEANSVFQKILAIEPQLKWIRDEVYPAFKRKYRF